MIYFATVHYMDDRWIDVQLRHLRRHVSDPYVVYACLTGPKVVRQADRFDFWHRRANWSDHGEQLTFLAEKIASEAADDDVLVFIDGDAFPVAPLDSALHQLLDESPLVAIRRDENEDTFPHPSFCATTVGFWRELGADWRDDLRASGVDVGGRLERRLAERGVRWKPLLRMNAKDLHPILFGVYGDQELGPLVYHHGAGFRGSHPITRADMRWAASKREPGGPEGGYDAELARRREENAELAGGVYERIIESEDFAAELFL
jgi:hypothetical protein